MSEQNTTHTVRYESPHPLSALPMNKWAQFLFGLLIIFVAFKMAWAGWFSRDLFGIQPGVDDGMGSPIGLLPFLIDGVCFIGILGFSLVAFIRDAVGPVFAGMGEWMANTSAENSAALAARRTGEGSAGTMAGTSAVVTAGKAEVRPRVADAAKIAAKFKLVQDAINTLHRRTAALEALHPELQPEPEPEPLTPEEMHAQLLELRQELAAMKAEVEDEDAEPPKPTTRKRSAKS